MPTEIDDTGVVDCVNDHGEAVARITLRAKRRRGSTDAIPLIVKLEESEARKEYEAPLQLRENGRYSCIVENLIGTKRLTLADDKLVIFYGEEDSEDVLIETRSTAGRLNLKVVEARGDGQVVAQGAVEVRSTKLHYREEYRGMIKSIANDAREMLMQLGGATQFSLQSAWSDEPPTLVQQIEFMRTLLHGGGLWQPLERILRMPHEQLDRDPDRRALARVGKAGPQVLRQLASGKPRMQLLGEPGKHVLYDRLNGTAPRHVTINSKRRTTDTPENRFVKHMLKDFTRFLMHAVAALEREDTKARTPKYTAVIGECEQMKEALNQRLQNSLFRQLEPPRTPPFGSPVLQRKAGYREVFQTWLAFKMSAHLQWEGSEDVFGGGNTEFDAGKKDLPTLYEAWLFFKLLGVFTKQFGLNYEEAKKFFTNDGGPLGHFTLKRGTMREIGSATIHGLGVRAKFRYNHKFRGNNRGIHQESSWTRELRPDYTISIWPEGMNPKEAEKASEIVHLHFDAKYRVNKLSEIFGSVEDENEEDDEDKHTIEKQNEIDGNYNRADLLKMHAYRDAIRRSEGAFVLYPGDTEESNNNRMWQGFHELLPGLGAFAVRPDKDGEPKGIEAVKTFLKDAVAQLTNRATRLAHARYHQRGEYDMNVKESRIENSDLITLGNGIIKELFKGDEDPPPPAQEIVVLSGIVKDVQHREWIERNQCYNFRADEEHAGYLPQLAPSYPRARILVLRTEDKEPLPGLWKIAALEEWDREKLKSEGYPTEPTANHYTIFKIERISVAEGVKFDDEVFMDLLETAHNKVAERLTIERENISSKSPFEINLKQLMGVVRRIPTTQLTQ